MKCVVETADKRLRGLVIQREFLDLIFAKKKDWELRGSNSNMRGRIALIESGLGLLVGQACMIDGKYYEETHAWVLKGARRLKRAVKYKHPTGAVIWVKLSKSVEKKVP